MEDPPQVAVERSAPSHVVDATGHRCPAPTLRLRRALEGLQSGDRVLLLADDPMARIDVPHFVTGQAHILLDRYEEGAVLYFLVEKS